ncbi:MAG: hypothetical protein KDB00_23005 [Planctomycetales bacterium]|nr:hypothetical protein [Planctomycetales bacterium]
MINHTDEQNYMSVGAGMNQRYHQHMAEKWQRCDRGFRIAVGVLSTLGICLSSVSAVSDAQSLTAASLGVAAIATCVAIVLNVFPFGEWSQSHATLFARWTDFREDIDQVKFMKATAQQDALARLQPKYHRLCGQEPPADKKLLDRCFEEEEASRVCAA